MNVIPIVKKYINIVVFFHCYFRITFNMPTSITCIIVYYARIYSKDTCELINYTFPHKHECLSKKMLRGDKVKITLLVVDHTAFLSKF